MDSVSSLVQMSAKCCSKDEVLFIYQNYSKEFYDLIREGLFDSELEEESLIEGWELERKNGQIAMRKKKTEDGGEVQEFFDCYGNLDTRLHYQKSFMSGKRELFEHLNRYELCNFSGGKLEGIRYQWYTQDDLERLSGLDRCKFCPSNDGFSVGGFDMEYAKMQRMYDYLRRYSFVRSICSFRKGKKHGKEFEIVNPEMEVTSTISYKHGKRHGIAKWKQQGKVYRLDRQRKGKIIFSSVLREDEDGREYDILRWFDWRTGEMKRKIKRYRT